MGDADKPSIMDFAGSLGPMPDDIRRRIDGTDTPFHLPHAVWRARRDDVMQIIADADATLSYKGCQQTAESILAALGFERDHADREEGQQ